MDKQDAAPKLAPPGAGLPWPQSWIARLTVPGKARKASWDWSRENFDKRAAGITKLVAGLTPQQLEKKILVPPLIGLEDSSRYWSIAMTLEHVGIVSEGMSKILVSLSQGKTVPFDVDIAKLKPKEAVATADVVRHYEDMIVRVRNRVANETQDKTSPTRHKHPWFGKFTAHQWYWILGVHLGIHQKQIQEIRARI